jgi:hypothetical protein
MAITVQEIESSTIARVGYDDIERDLYIEFTSNKTYVYWAVPESVRDALLRAHSKGTYFGKYIRDGYTYMTSVMPTPTRKAEPEAPVCLSQMFNLDLLIVNLSPSLK